jgi:ribosomal protein L7/L12
VIKATINSNIMLQEQFISTLKQLIQTHKTIEAIKLIRDFTGKGLQESRDLYELFNEKPALLDNYNFDNKGHEINQNGEMTKNDLDDSLLYEIKKLLSDNNKVYAISYLKEIKKISLQNAEAIVNEIENSVTGTYNFTTGLFGYSSEETGNEIKSTSEQKYESVQKKTSLNTGIPIIPTLPSVQKHKLKKLNTPVAEPIIFAKVAEREKHLRKDRSNSGCLIMLSLLIIIGIFITRFLF